MEGVSPWQPPMQQWVKRRSCGCRNDGGFEGGRWNVIPTVVLNEPEVLFDVCCGPPRTALVSAAEVKIAPRHATILQCRDDAVAPLSTWPLALRYIAALCQYCRVAPSHCFLYRIILANPCNPTVAKVEYQARAVSPLTFLSNVIFLSFFFAQRITTLKEWHLTGPCLVWLM